MRFLENVCHTSILLGGIISSVCTISSPVIDSSKSFHVQENGQRRYGPPPNWTGPPPPRGCEIFVGKIPRDCYEDELVPAFESCGQIYEFRLMMDFSGSNRGYSFVTYTRREDAQRAIDEMNNYEIRRGRFLGVCLSVDNCWLFVGGIPRSKQPVLITSSLGCMRCRCLPCLSVSLSVTRLKSVRMPSSV